MGGTEGITGSILTHRGIARITGLQAVLGAATATSTAATSSSAAPATTSSPGGGDDIIDGDKWLNVRISVRANADGTGGEIASHNSMKTLVAQVFSGQINPGQLQIVREIVTDTTAGDTDIAVFSGAASEYIFAGNADGSIQVTHTVEDGDGFDKRFVTSSAWSLPVVSRSTSSWERRATIRR